MALINCGECERMASDQAAACPHCGAPIAGYPTAAPTVADSGANRRVGFALGAGVFLLPIVFVWFLLRQGHSSLSRVLGFAWLAVGLLFVFTQEQEGEGLASDGGYKPSEVSTAAASAPVYTAQQLAQAYDSNTVAADQRFKGKRFQVTGTVESINTDMFGNPYVTLRGGVNQFMEPQFELEKAHANYAATLQRGMRVSLICTGRGDIAKIPMSQDCAPVVE